jgi:AcrR family transcriptional regulator
MCKAMAGRPRTVSDQAILAATGRAIARHGPARLTLAGVAAEAGLAAPTLIQRFGSKRGLLLAFARHGAQAAGATAGAAAAAAPSPAAGLVDGLVALAAGVASPEELAHHVAMLQIDLVDPDFRVAALEHDRAVREALRPAAAALAPEDPDGLLRDLRTAYDGSLVGWALHREGPLEAWLRADLGRVLSRRTTSSAAPPRARGAGRR